MEPTSGVGDTPHLSSEPALVDTSGEPVLPPPQGDRHERGVRLLQQDRPNLPTAGELRALGYIVEDAVADDEIPTRWQADTPARPGEVKLVDEPFVQLHRPPASESAPEPAPESAQGASESPTVPATAPEPAAATEQPPATPAAEERAQEVGVDLAAVAGTGKEGRITKADIEAAVDESASKRRRA